MEMISGIVLLLLVDGGNSGIGRWHWVAGLAMTVFAAIHVAIRRKALLSALDKLFQHQYGTDRD